MKLHYDRLESAISSLKDSTNLDIQLTNEGIQLRGRNSPFRSKQGLYMYHGHKIPGLVVLQNNNHRIALSKFSSHFEEKSSGIIFLKVPAYHFTSFFPFPLSIPGWLDGNIYAILPNFFQEYTTDGTPLFTAPDAKLVLDNPTGDRHELTFYNRSKSNVTYTLDGWSLTLVIHGNYKIGSQWCLRYKGEIFSYGDVQPYGSQKYERMDFALRTDSVEFSQLSKLLYNLSILHDYQEVAPGRLGHMQLTIES